MKNVVCLFLIFFALVSCERRPPNYRSNVRPTSQISQRKESISTSYNTSPSVVRMRKCGGVYMIPVKLNGTEMDVIFDTGASDIVISSLEASFLVKQGKLTEEDIIGNEYYQTADGNVSEGTIVVLHTVQIGDRVLRNIRATVVDNIDAPLLLGQSALQKFGKISIDYTKGVIILN